ncbi:hypothetical protein AMATHDRAFT_143874 [Amanita thiersii Skay4041]|uniref:Calcineurin-like phosphoesterase domain-containing protein n=1 Tax=Amanita thiersii Skay4041 TaxID=703135 RepID=A0A2A9NRE5_9AGAR|nr:hypothetical protein AMATHDRAFT_143874 [Amanita thiersii Skay4041]
MSRRLTVSILKFVWAAVILWFEYGVFWYAVRQCEWPDSHLTRHSSSDTTHVLVVADPQILNHRSYPGRPSILTYISQVIVDLNIRKSWRQATRLKPHAVVFLGDMMDGGRFPMDDAEYEKYYRRFKHIFSIEPGIPEYFIPGNHDIGLRMTRNASKKAHERYISHFGPLNQLVALGGYKLVMIDAPGLVEEDYIRERKGYSFQEWKSIPGGAVEFVKAIAEGVRDDPVILFSHIPLSRPDAADCGPLRERGTIHPGIGDGYQNTLGDQATDFLLQSLTPSLILSGDDHDYCEYYHNSTSARSASTRVREVTVKSLSMAMNVKFPGFQLLSLTSDQRQENGKSLGHADELCLLPDQLSIYLFKYIPLLLVSLLILFVVNTAPAYLPQPFRSPQAVHTGYQGHMTRLGHRALPGRDSGRDPMSDSYYHNDLTLPPPLSAAKCKPRPRTTWTFHLLGRRRRISFPWPLALVSKAVRDRLLFHNLTVKGRSKHVLKRSGVIGGFINDTRAVASIPLSIIVLISCWILYY